MSVGVETKFNIASILEEAFGKRKVKSFDQDAVSLLLEADLSTKPILKKFAPQLRPIITDMLCSPKFAMLTSTQKSIDLEITLRGMIDAIVANAYNKHTARNTVRKIDEGVLTISMRSKLRRIIRKIGYDYFSHMAFMQEEKKTRSEGFSWVMSCICLVCYIVAGLVAMKKLSLADLKKNKGGPGRNKLTPL